MPRYAIGIDLGTTHSAVSYLNLEGGQARGPAQSMLPIPQLTAPGTVEARTLLPSFLYLPGEASPEAASAICTSSEVFFKATGAFCSLLGCFSSSWLHLSVSCGSAAEGSSGEGLTLVLAGYGRPLKLAPKSGSRHYVLKRAIIQVQRYERMQQHSLSSTGCCPYD